MLLFVIGHADRATELIQALKIVVDLEAFPDLPTQGYAFLIRVRSRLSTSLACLIERTDDVEELIRSAFG